MNVKGNLEKEKYLERTEKHNSKITGQLYYGLVKDLSYRITNPGKVSL